jgi:hypothetical protein
MELAPPAWSHAHVAPETPNSGRAERNDGSAIGSGAMPENVAGHPTDYVHMGFAGDEGGACSGLRRSTPTTAPRELLRARRRGGAEYASGLATSDHSAEQCWALAILLGREHTGWQV